MITGQEVMLKDQSTFKKSAGNEAATKSLGMGVVTHTIQGEASFVAWSMDVKFEGANVPRHLDMTIHNEQSNPCNTPPWAYQDAAGTTPIKECEREVARKNAACQGKTTPAQQCDDKACKAAKKCLLISKGQADSTSSRSTVACCPGETGHHIVEVHGFSSPAYKENAAPCICAQCPQDGRGRYEGDHGFLHAIQGILEQAAIERAPPALKGQAWTYQEARAAGMRAVQLTFPASKCSRACLRAQIDSYHHGIGVKNHDRLDTTSPPLQPNQKELAKELIPVTITKW
jgi:hypothetical protein